MGATGRGPRDLREPVAQTETSPAPVAGAPPAGDVLVRVRGLVKHFPVQSSKLLRRNREVVHAVEGIDLDVRRGETLGIVGETGCGKSTLARCIARLYDITAGEIIFDGRDISRLGPRQMRPLRREMQVVFQDPYGSLNPRRRVGSIIGDPFAIHGLVDGAERKRRVQEVMELVGLKPEHYNRFPAEFSGGQRQRIGVARALALQPKLIICDEPVSALDVSIQAQIINLLADLQHNLELTYIFIAHDLSIVRHVSDRVAVMYLGKVAELGATRDLYGAPRHPYTSALLSAVPVPDPSESAKRQRIVLVGDVPSPIHPPTGCRFHPRCPKAAARCVTDEPALVGRLGDANGHLAACHFPVSPADDLSTATPTIPDGERGGMVEQVPKAVEDLPVVAVRPSLTSQVVPERMMEELLRHEDRER